MNAKFKKKKKEKSNTEKKKKTISTNTIGERERERCKEQQLRKKQATSRKCDMLLEWKVILLPLFQNLHFKKIKKKTSITR